MRAMLAALPALLALSLCACGSSPQVHYYTLSSERPSLKTLPEGAAPPYAVAVGPVSVPATVDRPQFVIQVAPNRVALVDDHRWAEPLKEGIAHAMASDLSAVLGVRAAVFPQDSLAGVKYRVAVDIRNFVSVPHQAVSIEAWWTVYGPGDKVKFGRSVVREPANGGYEDLAAAHGRAVQAISRDVAAAVQNLEAGR